MLQGCFGAGVEESGFVLAAPDDHVGAGPDGGVASSHRHGGDGGDGLPGAAGVIGGEDPAVVEEDVATYAAAAAPDHEGFTCPNAAMFDAGSRGIGG